MRVFPESDYDAPEPEISGWMYPKELEWLYQNARERKVIVEVGCWFGRSTHALLSGNAHIPGGVVFAVDHFRGSPTELEKEHKYARTGNVYEVFMRNCGGFPNLSVLAMPSTDAARKIELETVDMVFLDGEHTYGAVYGNLLEWIPKIRPGGLIAGHDRDLVPSKDDRGVTGALIDFFGFLPPIAAESIWAVGR